MLDDIDRRILRHLQYAPERPAAELAARVGIAAATCWRRLERLESAGILKGQRAEIDWRTMGYAVEVSLRVTLDKTRATAFDEFIAAARQLREVTEIQTFLGRVDVRLAVIARDMEHYQQVYREGVLALPHIAEIEALMHVATLKTEPGLPI